MAGQIGSPDRTCILLEEIAAVDSRVLVIQLRRNFGQTSALAAGFDNASGEFILAMDGDLQHDPTDIPAFIRRLNLGYDVVSGWRESRIDNLFLRRIPSRCANWLVARLSGAIDLAHPADADERNDLVVADFVACFEHHRSRFQVYPIRGRLTLGLQTKID